MNCQDIRKDLARYVADSLNEKRRKELREHLSSCQTCQSKLEDYQGLLTNLDDLEVHEAPADLSTSTMDLIRAKAPQPESTSLWERIQQFLSPQVFMPALGGVALACFFLLGSFVQNANGPATASIFGIASVETSDGTRSSATGQQNVPYGATVTAFAPNTSVLSYPDGSKVALKPSAKAKVETDGVRILAGTAECTFGIHPFTLRFPQCSVIGHHSKIQATIASNGSIILQGITGDSRIILARDEPRSLSAGTTITIPAEM